jgi:hypothetical protein
MRGEHDYLNSAAAALAAYVPLQSWTPFRANKWWAALLVGLDVYHEWKAGKEDSEREKVQGPGW